MRSIARLTLAFVTAVASTFALPALAQDLPNRVGRIAHIEGAASVYQDPDEGWEQAYVNAPFTTENSVWTEPGSRAELRVGGTAMRLDEATQLDITRLDDGLLDAFVPRGTVSVRVRHFEKSERMVFNTPHARFSVRANGRYRVDVDPDREESRLTVFAGEARVGSDSGRVRVQAGKTVRVFGGSAPSYVVENAFGDPFDRWAESRDAGWVESTSVKYVSSSMTGYEDLDRYGSWREEPEFGALWFPTRVASDWAPYRHGRWDYVLPWGWTWVDDAPWGYAPFHYGRWLNVGDRWAWSPGRREVRPTWAPALVAWVGGSNFSVGVSSGSPSVGWYPLSPWERYQPWYNASPAYVNQVNIIVRESPPRNERRAEWRDRTRERGVTVVNRDVVVNRRPVQQSLVSIRPDAARQVQVAAPATVLPSRNEMIQRRQTTRAAAPAATGAAPVTQRPGTAQTAPPRGDRAGPAARPEFQRRQAAAPVAPEPAKTAPPPAQPVTAPTPAAQQQAREQVLKAREEQTKGREAERLKARDDQQKAGSDQAKGRQDEPAARAAEQKAREAKQQQALEDQRKAREEQAKGREAERLKAREDQQKAGSDQAKARADQQKAAEEQRKARDEQVKSRGAEQQKAAEDQRKAREEQMKGREAEQQKAREQQQNAREEQAKARADQQKAAEEQRKARDEQVKSRGAEQQKAAEEQRKAREEQMKGREAERMKAREQQQKAAEEQRKPREAQQQEQQQRAPAAAAGSQPTPQERAQQQRQEREKQSREAKEKDDEEKEKKGKAGR